MVRFKNRYLLFEIIYADTPLGWTSIPAATASAIEAANQSLGPDQGVFGDTGRNNCRLPPISSKDLINIFRTSIGDNFGDYGAGITQRGLVLKYFSPHTNIGILRISREEMHIAWGALTFIKELKGRPCIIKVLHTSGTIKHCQLTTIRYDRDRIMFLRNQAQLLNDSQTYTQLGLAFKDSAEEVNALEV
ncbi:hypothetical protein BGZ75_005204 [Mortierella antarctica]|nr:hypothetical protein BGZ67_004433 [Mortierella alpina]KAF9983338.1 hypothetical protein BGZ75_005204 [Mortierella antarctica]